MATKVLKTQTVDLETGEILEGNLAWIPAKKRSTFSKEGFTIMSNPAMLDLAKMTTFNADARVLFACASQLNYQNYIQIEQAKLAEAIGMLPQHFSRAVARLVEQGVLLRGPKRTLMFNSDVAYRGDAKNQSAIMKAQKPFKVIHGGLSIQY